MGSQLILARKGRKLGILGRKENQETFLLKHLLLAVVVKMYDDNQKKSSLPSKKYIPPETFTNISNHLKHTYLCKYQNGKKQYSTSL